MWDMVAHIMRKNRTGITYWTGTPIDIVMRTRIFYFVIAYNVNLSTGLVNEYIHGIRRLM